jgi:ABC-type glycerol-3-phosphate transport system substrate-binding protein
MDRHAMLTKNRRRSGVVAMNRLAWVPKVLLLLAAGCSLEQEQPGAGITLEVAVFEGGYGIDWHKDCARRYEQEHPGIRVNLWGDPRVDEKLKPRILRHSPPDLTSWNLPVWKLIVAGKLYPLDEALDSPACGQNMTWRQSLVPGILDDSRYEGKTYAVPSNRGAWVCWYDAGQFRRHGWKPPRTWGEFTALADTMKAAGVAPVAFQGKYPTYAWATLLSLYQRLVPFERWYAMQDLEPGAFTDPEFIQAARLLQEMAVRYYQPGALAMTHTESQMEWVNGRAAMIFCGLWLKNEMKNAIPPGFEMACFPVPMIEGGKGDPRAIYAWGAESFFVFADARHPKEAADFLKFMLSLASARDYVQRLDTLSSVRDSEKGIRISPELQSAVDVLNQSSRIFSDRLGDLYLEFTRTAMQQSLGDLMAAKITPAQFGARLEAAIEDVRRNPDIYKPPARGVPSS